MLYTAMLTFKSPYHVRDDEITVNSGVFDNTTDLWLWIESNRELTVGECNGGVSWHKCEVHCEMAP